jgi:hypothetical protein
VTYYEDLSKYEYSDSENSMVNVGWLGVGHSFTTGDFPPELRDPLLYLSDEVKKLMRGFHDCEFCEVRSPIFINTALNSRGAVMLGSGEVHVVSEGIIYAAPSLLIHYIDEHSYLPPASFLEGLRNILA